MKPKRYLQLAAAVFLVAFVCVAQAQNTIDPGVTPLTIGPEDNLNHFPVSVTDSNGVVLGLCLDPANCFADPPIAGNQFSQDIGFGAEAFWYSASTAINLPAGIAVYGADVEAAWANGDPPDPFVAGQNFPFTRIRFRMPVAAGEEGTYTITHPYGEIVLNVVTAGPAAINVTEDLPFAAVFNGPFSGNVGPFLTAVTPPPPAGFLGNFNVLATVDGSPSGNNLVSIQGPAGANLDGAGGNVVQIDQFNVMGQILTITPMAAAPATANLVSGEVVTVNITGGAGGITAASSNTAIATATVQGRSIIIQAGATGGTATITVSDSSVPANTTTVTATVTATTLAGVGPGGPTRPPVLVTPIERVSLVLDITNAAGATPAQIAQEWLVVLIGSGASRNIFFLTADGRFVPLNLAIASPGGVTYNTFDHTRANLFIGSGTLGPAGFRAGDFLIYGYAYSATPVTNFGAAPDLVIENFVRIDVQ